MVYGEQEHKKLQRLRKKASRLSATELQQIAVVKGMSFTPDSRNSSSSSSTHQTACSGAVEEKSAAAQQTQPLEEALAEEDALLDDVTEPLGDI